MGLVCPVILPEYVNASSYDFMCEPVNSSEHPAKLSSHGLCGSGDILVLVCHMIVQDYLIKKLFDVMVWNPSW